MTPPPSPAISLRLKFNHKADHNQPPANKPSATETSDDMPRRKAAPCNEAPLPPTLFVIKKTEGWRPADNPEGKIDHKILGIFKHCASANTFAHQYLAEQWSERYEHALETKLVNGAISLEMETGKEDGVVFIDVEEHVVDGRFPWEMV